MGVLMVVAVLAVRNTPAPVVLPNVIASPPLRVMTTPSSKVMLLAACVVSTVTVPAVTAVPAEKKRLSAMVVDACEGPLAAPVESVFQKTLVPHVPVAGIAVIAVSFGSQ